MLEGKTKPAKFRRLELKAMGDEYRVQYAKSSHSSDQLPHSFIVDHFTRIADRPHHSWFLRGVIRQDLLVMKQKIVLMIFFAHHIQKTQTVMSYEDWCLK
jgi:hypothetical protein